MVIVVKYFASISDAVGKTSEKIVLQHEMTVGEVWTDVSKNIKYAGKVMTAVNHEYVDENYLLRDCLLYTSPSPRDVHLSRMPSSA